MADLFPHIKRLSHLSGKSAPPALRQALQHIFSQVSEGVWLVGGTALAGFYAEHRHSDDLDLFAKDAFAFKAAVAAVKSLQKKKAVLSDERSSASYYHVLCRLAGHSFTIDVVLDENLHRIGNAWKDDDGVIVADLATLLTMKMATLISRASEKDLYDLNWFFERIDNPDLAEWIKRARLLDGGITLESLLYSLAVAKPREDACHFTLPRDDLRPRDVLKKIIQFKKQLMKKICDLEIQAPLSDAAAGIKASVVDFRKMRL